jgi:predicted ArsR family transcriptional regulator
MSAAAADIELDRDSFLRALLRELSGALQDVVGLEAASGYISLVGAAVGRDLDSRYRAALKVDRLSREQVPQVLVSLKQRIGGEFLVIEEHSDRIVLAGRACPFGAFVKDRPALCMMTSNVFGHIAAENLGYARVQISEAIARGDAACRVTVFLAPSDEHEDDEAGVREYFRRDPPDLVPA